MIDRNKTTLTHDVTHAASRWLEERGFKPVETEVSVCAGWCADLAGVIVPTMTELIELKFLRRQPRWKYVRGKIPIYESPERIAWETAYKRMDRTMTALVEVKTSRGDFRGDRKWKLIPPTDLAYVAVPAGMVKREECPASWGVLEFHAGNVRCIQTPIPFVSTLEQQFGVVLSIAVRRDHHTRHERWREYLREERVERGGEKTIRRVADIAKMLLHVAHGEGDSLERVLQYQGIKNMPEYVMERIRPLWGIAKK